MTRNWRHMPGRRTTAGVIAAAIAATGITYAGLHLDRPGASGATSPVRPPGAVGESAAIDQAADSGKPVEITALRTARSTTWARPDGLLAKDLHTSPVRVKSGGEWRDIELGLRRTEEGWRPRSSPTDVVFTAGSPARASDRASRRTGVRNAALIRAPDQADPASSPLVTLTVGAHTIQLTWPGPVPAPIIDGPRALYPEILPGTDLVLTADNGGFGQVIVLKNRQAAADPRVRQLAYGISSPDLTFRLDPVSGILAAENGEGDEVAVSPTPLMWDNSGAPAVTDGTVGTTAQPTAPETPDPAPTGTTDPEPSPSAGGEDPVEADEQADPEAEVLPPATDGPEPVPSEPPLPSAPAEPTAEPTGGGPSATLGLASLNGPSPDSRGDLVEVDLDGNVWSFAPGEEFLTDPATTYPVFVDPSVSAGTQNWTTTYKRHPHATFYNGKGFNKAGTHEARVGFESDTWGTSRSYFNISFDKDLQGTKISSARLRLLETYSWSCNPRSVSVHQTGAVTRRTNWKNAPDLHNGNKLSTKSFAHGYNSSCRDAYETFDVKRAAQKQADSREDDDSITFGLRARDEDSQYAWKKFQANGDNAPKMTVIYNRKPDTPTSLDLSPDAKCTTSEPYTRMADAPLRFTARATDRDKNLDHFDFDLWPTGQLNSTGDLLGSTGRVSVGGDTSSALRSTTAFGTDRLVSGKLYSWRVRAVDDAGASSAYAPTKTPCRFVFDRTEPKPPEISSTDFPDADARENGFGSDTEDARWSIKKFGTPGKFTLRALNQDVVRYEYGFNSTNYPFSVTRSAGTSTSVTALIDDARPPTAGPNVLYVRTADGAGNFSQPTKYFFYVTPRDEADAPGDFTGDELPDLMAVTEGGNLALYPSQAIKDLSRGSGDLDYSMPGAYRPNPDKDPNGDTLPPFVAAPSGHFKGSLITHNGDIYGADGLQDLIVRAGGKLWVYPGDGYGAVNIEKRREILLPENAPDPGTFTQIVSAGDATDDGRSDFFVTVGDEFWALTGYHGASVGEATRLSSATWDQRDIVTVGDITGDNVADLVFRTGSKLMLRKGIAATGGGVKLSSLATEAGSAGGTDAEYGASGWSATSYPFLMGTPDANGDSIPDIWAVRSDGSVRFYPGARTALSGSGSEIISPRSYWRTRIAIG